MVAVLALVPGNFTIATSQIYKSEVPRGLPAHDEDAVLGALIFCFAWLIEFYADPMALGLSQGCSFSSLSESPAWVARRTVWSLQLAPLQE